MARSSKLCALVHWLLAPNPRDRLRSDHLCQILQKIRDVSYEDLVASMPAAVQEKIKQIEKLYKPRRSSKDDEEPEMPKAQELFSTGGYASQSKQQDVPWTADFSAAPPAPQQQQQQPS